MAVTALVVLAAGAEEMETVIVVDMLRRAGVTVTVAGLAGEAAVTCSRGLIITPDTSLAGAVEGGPLYDAVVLPGGGQGAEALAASKEVGEVLKEQEAGGRIIAAVCAAPTALLAHGIARGKRLTAYPAFKAQLEGCYTYTEEAVEVDGSLVTSRGPGTSFQFGLELVKLLVGGEKAGEVAKAMLL